MARMFDEVAPVYDRLNTVMTLGIDSRWRRRAVAETRLRAGESAVDVCCGTGKLAALLAERVGPFGRVEGIDLSPAMIDLASERLHSLVQAHFAVGNALELSFPDGEFDAATIGFGLRNLSDFEAGFRELARVVRPGGRIVCLELSLPPSRALARLYHGTFHRGAPLAARLLGGPADAYSYLPQSLEGFPSADQVAEQMQAAGLLDVRYVRMAGGAVCLHWGNAPARQGETEAG
ncbi:MAG: demethylmenaquinone methyltransferase / 2-methoxy-6-polyprenyl,4-benzoquinol methylase [Chloroflexota bacterium]|jgi:demethylmenaquinone methyltransferase/2-methoxy-6-polyprenyl-1,4-benzoquinol methylase|nr:demethylmenaquinone methyltransferase / 2-methoxy-6-polyprenyl,4-benzoquinol methylase [Chloroflexota bacterium]